MGTVKINKQSDLGADCGQLSPCGVVATGHGNIARCARALLDVLTSAKQVWLLICRVAAR